MRRIAGNVLIGLAVLGAVGAVLLAANLLYFVAFFYPVYSMVVMDRAVEVARCQRMKTILILFGSVHLLIALALLAMSRA